MEAGSFRYADTFLACVYAQVSQESLSQESLSSDSENTTAGEY